MKCNLCHKEGHIVKVCIKLLIQKQKPKTAELQVTSPVTTYFSSADNYTVVVTRELKDGEQCRHDDKYYATVQLIKIGNHA